MLKNISEAIASYRTPDPKGEIAEGVRIDGSILSAEQIDAMMGHGEHWNHPRFSVWARSNDKRWDAVDLYRDEELLSTTYRTKTGSKSFTITIAELAQDMDRIETIFQAAAEFCLQRDARIRSRAEILEADVMSAFKSIGIAVPRRAMDDDLEIMLDGGYFEFSNTAARSRKLPAGFTLVTDQAAENGSPGVFDPLGGYIADHRLSYMGKELLHVQVWHITEKVSTQVNEIAWGMKEVLFGMVMNEFDHVKSLERNRIIEDLSRESLDREESLDGIWQDLLPEIQPGKASGSTGAQDAAEGWVAWAEILERTGDGEAEPDPVKDDWSQEDKAPEMVM